MSGAEITLRYFLLVTDVAVEIVIGLFVGLVYIDLIEMYMTICNR